MLKLNYEILLMNCIYKTNVYKILLYIIIGVIFLNTTYFIIFAFLLVKMVDDYHCFLLVVENFMSFLIF